MQPLRFDPFDLFVRTPRTSEPGFVPAVDVTRHDDRWVVSVEVPGVDPDDVHVEVADGYLTISGERSTARNEKDAEGTWVVRERTWGRFERRIALPKEVDGSAVSASYDNGVLEITLPKSAASQPHKVQIART